MTDPERPDDSPRPSFAPLLMSFFVLAGVALFLILASGGFFLYVFAGVAVIYLVGLLHYWTWGSSMHRQTEGEREEERLREEFEEDSW